MGSVVNSKFVSEEQGTEKEVTALRAPNMETEVNNNVPNNKVMRGDDENLFSVRACIHDLIEDTTRARPSATALESSVDQFTYTELNDISNVLAKRLFEAGVRRGDRVACIFEKSSWGPIAMLAILKAKGVAVPLDPTHPRQRLALVVQKAGILTAVTSTKCESVLSGLVLQTVIADRVVEMDKEVLSSQRQQDLEMIDPKSRVFPDDAAVVVFTSGSTGTPKGVILSHSAICSSAHHHAPAMFLSTESRVLQYAAYTFDISVYDIFTTLITGGTICTPTDDQRVNGLVEVINDLRINWACLVPSLLTTFEPDDIPAVETVTLAAEMAPQAVIDKWADKVHLINCYGSTESSTCIPGLFYKGSRPGFMGIPRGIIPYVVDELDHNKVLPAGQPGELLVVGPVIASGYVNEPEKTSTAFPRNIPALQSATHCRAYRTGDIVEQSSTGELRYLGRKDSLVKVRGQRVELDEVEHHVRAHGEVAACVILFPRQGKHVNEIVAVVQIKSSQRLPKDPQEMASSVEMLANFPQRAEIIAFLKRRMPAYMLPAQWFHVRTLPMTSSGKADRIRLLESLPDASKTTYDSFNENSTKESRGANISARVRELLPTSMIREDWQKIKTCELSDCGFDSIRLMALARYIKSNYGRQIDIHRLAKESTVSLEKMLSSDDCAISQTNLKLTTELKEILGDARKKKAKVQQSSSHVIFLTGAVGLLGIHVLHSILRQAPASTNIILLIRASNSLIAHHRLLQAFEKHGMDVTSADLDRMEIWLGDLRFPKFRLTTAQWRRLQGSKVAVSDDESHNQSMPGVDSIVHCGARVDWAAGFSSLKMPNVESTLQLLQSGVRRSSRDQRRPDPKFVYVSGGRALEFALQRSSWMRDTMYEDDSVLPGAARAMLTLGELSEVPLSGYDATKLLSDALVLSSGGTSDHFTKSIVRSGYIIGDSVTGCTNSKDFIWRLTAAAMRLKKRCAEDQTAWLYIADVRSVANRVSQQVVVSNSTSVSRERGGEIVEDNMTCGVAVNDFWKLVSGSLNVDLEPASSEEWLHILQEDVGLLGIEHPMFPFLDVHVLERGMIGMTNSSKLPCKHDASIEPAIRMTIKYLQANGQL